MVKNPQNFDEALKLIDDPQLKLLLRARLVQLAFGAENTVAIKAIELLLAMPTASANRLDEDAITTEELIGLRYIVEQRLLRTRSTQGSEAPYHNGTGAAAVD